MRACPMVVSGCWSQIKLGFQNEGSPNEKVNAFPKQNFNSVTNYSLDFLTSENGWIP